MKAFVVVALITYGAPDGLYLDKGAADGVRVGDRVTLPDGGELAIEAVAERASRTGPPTDAFAPRRSERVKVHATATRAAAPPASREPPLPGPGIEQPEAAGLWAAVPDGWAAPRPHAAPGGRPGTEDAGERWRARGRLSLRGTALRDDVGARTHAWGGLDSRLDAARGTWTWGHDLAGWVDGHDGRHSYRPLEALRAEAGWRTDGLGVRAGRVLLSDPLLYRPVDGAAVRLGPVRVYGGVVPNPESLVPAADEPVAGASWSHDVRLGAWHVRGGLSALGIAWQGGLDRAAVAPTLLVTGPWLTVSGLAEGDLLPAGADGADATVALTRAYAFVQARVWSWLDTSARYATDRYPATPSRVASAGLGLPVEPVRSQDGWLDVRLHGGWLGTLTPAVGVLSDDRGTALAPALDYTLPLPLGLRFGLGGFYHPGPLATVEHGRARLSAALDTAWPLDLEVGARYAGLRPKDRDDTDREWTGELGADLWAPSGLSVRVSGEHTWGPWPRTAVFGEAAWRFGP